MIHTSLAIVAFIACAKAQQNTYVATFAINDIPGSVTIDAQSVSVDLDLSAEPALPGGFSECIGDGLKWHIHEMWLHDDTTDRLGSTLCNSSYTGGHWDPWNACGSASGNQHCKKATSTEATKCIDVADYSPNYEADPFSAEVGDWSGKYGVLAPGTDNLITATFTSFYEVYPDDQLADLSVVFHCNSGTRAFCAPLELSTTAVTESVVPQETSQTVVALFDVLSDDSEIRLSPTGGVSITFDATNIEFTEETFGCSEFEYGIFEAVDTLETSAAGDDCTVAVGDQYDPTHQCLPWSGSPHCDDGVLCTDSDYSYNCDGDYSCAPGDLSGKFGNYVDVANTVFSKGSLSEVTLIPPTGDLIGKIAAIVCPKTDDTKKFLACAKFEEYVAPEDSDDGVAPLSFGIAFVMSFLSLIY
eukprot:109670_1